MKKNNLILITFFLLAVLFSCEEDKVPIGTNKVTISSTTAATVLYTTATVSSAVEFIKGNKVIEHGHCWGTEANPVVEGSKTTLGSLSEVKTFTSQLDQLSANTSYYIRPYITTEYETIYGKEISIKTIDYTKPTVTTATVSGTTTYDIAFSGGNVTADGGLPVTACGVVWNTTSEPTITNKIGITADGTGTGSFISQLTSLQPSTTFYIRAYATNSKGTNYGNEINFTTKALPVLASLTTSSPADITDNSITLGGTITHDGNTTITECGVCYSTSQNPTITSSKATATVGSGSFSVSVTGLLAVTTYYVRAYATNSQGTAYGNEVSFKTLEAPITDIDGNVYHTVTIGTQVWMVENLKTTRYNDGTPCYYRWYNNDESYKNPYGALYYHAAIIDKLAPIGWHIPSSDEWETLINYLGGGSVAGAKLKEAGTSHWNSPNEGASNSSGFYALPGGTANFYPVVPYGELGTWWTTTSSHSNYYKRSEYIYIQIEYNSSYASVKSYFWNDYDSNGNRTSVMQVCFSVRCIKD